MNHAGASGQPAIRTPDQHVRVFISSTLKEMARERAAARRAVKGLHLAPVMFELGARPHPARELYRAYLAQSHVFVGIYGSQYGWVAPGAEISGLEDEYRLAADKPKLIYIKGPGVERDPPLAALLADIRDRDGVAYKYFASPDELEELVTADLALLLSERFEGSGSQPEETAEGPASGLPALPTPTVGRQGLIAGIRELLLDDRVRCLTLTGPGGSGKTRLAVEAARRVGAELGGVSFVELGPVTDPALVPDEAARVLGLREAGATSAAELVLRYLRSRRWLLVLDNFEQVAEAGPFVARILESCPQVKVLVTSRVPLNIRGERETPVPPLDVPPPGEPASLEDLSRHEAIALFCERARAVRPGFSLSRENAASIAEICRRLDGLPLAIELAAPRVRLLEPQAILAHLEDSLALLSGGPADLPARQRTMRDAIAWSYELLPQEEASLFVRLSVFAGGFPLAAAQRIGGPMPAGGPGGDGLLGRMEALVAKNLLFDRADPAGETRLFMLETVRGYAREQLAAGGGEGAALTDHAEYYAALAEEAEPWLTSGKRAPWIARLEVELDNLRAVLRRGLERRIDPMLAIRLAGTLGWFWHLRGHLSEGRRWASLLSELPEASGRTRARAKVLFPAGGLAWSQGDYRACETALSESASIFQEVGDLQGLLNAQAILAGGVASLGDFERAELLCRRTGALMRESGDRWGLAFTLLWHGDVVLARSGDSTRAASMFAESLDIAVELGDPWIRAEALNHLAAAAAREGDSAAALSFFAESLGFHQATGDKWATARVLAGQAEVHRRLGELERARDLFVESARVWLEMGHTRGTAAALAGLARVAVALGEHARAARLRGAAPEAVTPLGYLFLQGTPGEYERELEPARRELGQARWGEETARGVSMSPEEAVAFAVAS